jgi:hypothetical protein
MVYTVDGFPKNREKFIRLMVFFKRILRICIDTDITPVLVGSFAVFVYTGKRALDVNDVDLICSEVDFPKIAEALKGERIEYDLKEWHVLQVFEDDLKVEFGSAEYWLQHILKDYERLKIDGLEIKILGRSSLKALYQQGMAEQAAKTKESSKIKYKDLKQKFEILDSVI